MTCWFSATFKSQDSQLATVARSRNVHVSFSEFSRCSERRDSTLSFFTGASLPARSRSAIPRFIGSSPAAVLLYFWILNRVGPAVWWLESAGQARHSVSRVVSRTNARSSSLIGSRHREQCDARVHTLFRTESFVRGETRLPATRYITRISVWEY